MPDLIAPHGGVSSPVSRTVADLRPPTTTPIPVSDADLSTLYRIGDGGLSPLTGPMGEEEYNRVLEEEVIVRNDKKYAWTIPLAFPVSAELASKLSPGTTYPLHNERNELVGNIELTDVFAWDKDKYKIGRAHV